MSCEVSVNILHSEYWLHSGGFKCLRGNSAAYIILKCLRGNSAAYTILKCPGQNTEHLLSECFKGSQGEYLWSLPGEWSPIWVGASTHDRWPAMGQVGRDGPSDPVGHAPTIVKSVGFWAIWLIFGSFERALTVDSAERITSIKSLLLRGNEYIIPQTWYQVKTDFSNY